MRRYATTLLGLAAAALAGTAAYAADTVKIGLIEPYSGQFADAATQQDNGIKLFMKQNGDMVAGGALLLARHGGAPADFRVFRDAPSPRLRLSSRRRLRRTRARHPRPRRRHCRLRAHS